MPKLIAVSDIHIHDYPQRNPEERFRLLQTRTMAQNIISVAKENGADIIILAGDILEKSVVRPYIQAEVKLFLDTLMAHFSSGFIIWGNHDIDNRHQNQLFTDACLSVMLPANLYYADQKQLQIGSSMVGFSNWKPEFDLSWIQGKLDVLFTHATISYSVSDKVKSQVLDDSKFDVAICGDIHKPAKTGKFVSIGIPQRCKMGDSSDCTGVIYDTETKSWDWVNLNPYDNLLKFEYTSVQEEEGYFGPSNTWKVYKPSNIGKVNGVNEISIPAWEEIGHLIDSVITSEGLEYIHSQVLQNCKDIESKEVDFDFRLERFYCKNWRSIEEVELYFNEGDKILIKGKNGSGKSSLLSAIKYAFVENRFIKDFIQFDQKECLTEIDFWYQGKHNRICRGSKKYGLWVDTVPVSYGSKKEFEEDLHRRFPFIDYLDVFFFDEDHQKLIGDITPERKSELVSKFFRLDRIDYFNSVASDLSGQLRKSIASYQEAWDNNQKVLAYINEKRGSLVLPVRSVIELQKLKEEGQELQRKSQAYSKYLQDSSAANARLEYLMSERARAVGSLSDMPALGVLEISKSKIEEEISEYLEKEKTIRRIQDSKARLEQELGRINTEGQKLYSEYSAIKADVCPCCGQEIHDGTVETYKKNLWNKINELLTRKTDLETEISGAKIDEKVFSEIRTTLRSLQTERDSAVKSISDRTNLENQDRELRSNIERLQRETGNQVIPEKAELPDNFLSIMSSIDNDLSVWALEDSLSRDAAEAMRLIDQASFEIQKVGTGLEMMDRYVKLTGPTGKIYEEIMGRLSKDFSDNQVKYEVVTYNFRKKDHLDLSSYYNKQGQWVSYQAASSGQKTILDVNFLSKIVTRLGVIVMDEFLKSLDPENHDLCIDMIVGMNVGCIMLSSHMESIMAFNNKSMGLALNDSGMTCIKLE